MGKKPSEIIGSDIKRQRYAQHIKAAYLLRREREAPLSRKVAVFWHYGNPGTGKSYTYLKLAEKYGRNEVFKVVRDLSKGKFDQYEGERILFLDEIKPSCIDWTELLLCLDNYIYHPSARYRDSVALWEEVHITSVYSPRRFYEECVPKDKWNEEPFTQLDRRIDVTLLHWKDKNGYHVKNENLIEEDYNNFPFGN